MADADFLSKAYDRGVMKRSHPLGMDVLMYLDLPGEYMTAHGTPVGEDFAAQAGFPIEILRKEKVKRERMAAAKIAIEQELELQAQVREIVSETNGFKIIAVGLGRHQVEDPDGNTLNKEPLSLEQAQMLLKALTVEASKPKA